MRFTSLRFIFCFFISLTLRVGLAQQVTISADHDSGVYEIGQPITFRVHASGDNAPHEVTYSLKKGGFTEIAKGTLPLNDGSATIESKLDEPNTLLAEIRWGDRHRALAGAVAAPEKIAMDAPRPADFDAFRVRISQPGERSQGSGDPSQIGSSGQRKYAGGVLSEVERMAGSIARGAAAAGQRN